MKLIGLALPAVLPLDNPLGTEPSKSSFYPAGIDFNSTTRVIPSSAKTTTLQHDMQMCSKKTSLMSFRLFPYSSCFMLHEERWPEMTSKMHKRHNRHKLYYRLFGDCRSGSLTEKRLECSALETWKTRNAASVAWQAQANLGFGRVKNAERHPFFQTLSYDGFLSSVATAPVCR